MSSISEETVKTLLENHFGYQFHKVRPDFLKNPETGLNLELDMYCRELNLAVEYNGQQHYEFPNKYHFSEDDFQTQLKHDLIKVDRCAKEGLLLVVISEKEIVEKGADLKTFSLQSVLSALNKRNQERPFTKEIRERGGNEMYTFRFKTPTYLDSVQTHYFLDFLAPLSGDYLIIEAEFEDLESQTEPIRIVHDDVPTSFFLGMRKLQKRGTPCYSLNLIIFKQISDVWTNESFIYPGWTNGVMLLHDIQERFSLQGSLEASCTVVRQDQSEELYRFVEPHETFHDRLSQVTQGMPSADATISANSCYTLVTLMPKAVTMTDPFFDTPMPTASTPAVPVVPVPMVISPSPLSPTSDLASMTIPLAPPAEYLEEYLEVLRKISETHQKRRSLRSRIQTTEGMLKALKQEEEEHLQKSEETVRRLLQEYNAKIGRH